MNARKTHLKCVICGISKHRSSFKAIAGRIDSRGKKAHKTICKLCSSKTREATPEEIAVRKAELRRKFAKELGVELTEDTEYRGYDYT